MTVTIPERIILSTSTNLHLGLTEITRPSYISDILIVDAPTNGTSMLKIKDLQVSGNPFADVRLVESSLVLFDLPRCQSSR